MKAAAPRRRPPEYVHPDVMDAWAEATGGAGAGDPDFGTPVPSLALVALRPVADEELLLDYRLSPGLSSRPGWYHPVSTRRRRSGAGRRRPPGPLPACTLRRWALPRQTRAAPVADDQSRANS